jgi:hypothetical protein
MCAAGVFRLAGQREALTTQWERERISHFAQSRGWQQVASELAAK